MNPVSIDSAFNALYDSTYRKTAAYLTARCRRLADVEDLLQETYLAVYRTLAARGPDALDHGEAYVLSAAKSKLADLYRKAGREPLLDDGDEMLLASVPDDAPSPQEIAEARDAAAAVAGLVAGKGEKLRQAFYLRCCFGVSFPEIARLQGRNEASVRSGVFRLTQELRAGLERRNK